MKMKHAMLLSAMTLALGANAAQADDVMKVYGQANLSYDSTSISDTSSKKVVGRTKGDEFKSNASRFGMKGALDTTLEGTAMIYQLEAQYVAVGANGDDATKEKNTIYVREAYAGLKNKQFGKIRMGRLTTGYKSSYTGIDPWTDHVLQARQSGQQGASNLNANYFNSSIEYVSPKFSGFEFNLHYSKLSDASTAVGIHNAGKLAEMTGGSANGFGVKYTHGGLRLTADSLTLNSDNNLGATNNTKAKNGTANQVTAKYAFGTGTSLAGLYEDATGVNLGTNIFAVVTQKVGKNGLLTASYGVNQAGDKNAYNKTEDATTIGLGAKYMLTKNAALVAGYSQFERGNKESASTVTLGIDAKFGY